MHDPIFLAGKSEPATKDDLNVAQDLLETLIWSALRFKDIRMIMLSKEYHLKSHISNVVIRFAFRSLSKLQKKQGLTN